MKLCPHCKKEKEVEKEFYRQGQRYSGWCRLCSSEWSKQQADSGYFRALRAKKSVLRGKKQRKTRNPLISKCDLLWRNARRRSIRDGKEFAISKEWVVKKVTDFCNSNYHSFYKQSPFQPSLDRIDPNLSYTEDNTQIIWLIENYAKHRFTDEQVIEFCKRKLGFKL